MTLHEIGWELEFALAKLYNELYFGLELDILLDKLNKLL